jgi:hypothetical protein
VLLLATKKYRTMVKKIVVLFLLINSQALWAQRVTGTIYERNEAGKKIALGGRKCLLGRHLLRKRLPTHWVNLTLLALPNPTV